jgi:predicted Holliday junction resolvase-like endonuclease
MNIWIITILLQLIEVIIIIIAVKKIKGYRNVIEKLSYKKRSEVIRFGKTFEQYIPFVVGIKYPVDKFRMLGGPIDGIYFMDSEILFVEFKTGQSKLTEKEKNIQKLVDEKKIRFEVIRIGINNELE